MFSEKLKNLTDEELASFIDVCDNCNTNVTIVDDVLEGTKYTYLKKLDLCIAGNSQLFSTEESGFLPDIMLDLYNKRVIAKGLMLEYKQKLEDSTTPEDKKKYTDLIAKYHLQQHSMKISLNSAYGAIGNEYFRYYDLRQAEAITISGQLSIKWISQKVNGMLNSTLKTTGVDYTTYIDTDSIYLQLNEMVKKFTKPDATTNDIINFLDKASKEAIEPFIENCYKELASNMSAYKQAMSMDREVIADKAIFVSKKRYIVSVWDNEGTRYHEQKLKIMGLEVVKSATPPAVKIAMQDCINIIMKQGEPELHDYIDKFKDKFFNLPVNDIALKKNCNRIDTYSDPVSIYRKGTPITQRGGLLYNHYLAKYNIDTKYKPITSGEKLYNVYLTVPNDIMSENVITYPDEIPEEFNLANNIDYDLQYEKVFISPMMGILTCIGWNTEPKNTLDFLF